MIRSILFTTRGSHIINSVGKKRSESVFSITRDLTFAQSQYRSLSSNLQLDVFEEKTEETSIIDLGISSNGLINPSKGFVDRPLDVSFQVAPPYPTLNREFDFLEILRKDTDAEERLNRSQSLCIEKARRNTLNWEYPKAFGGVLSSNSMEQVYEKETPLTSKSKGLSPSDNNQQKTTMGNRVLIGAPEKKDLGHNMEAKSRLESSLEDRERSHKRKILMNLKNSIRSISRNKQQNITSFETTFSYEPQTSQVQREHDRVFQTFVEATLMGCDVSTKDCLDTMEYFNRSRRLDQVFRVFQMYETLRKHQTNSAGNIETEETDLKEAYLILCEAVGSHAAAHIIEQVPRQVLYKYTEGLYYKLKEMNIYPYQSECLPRLLLSLVMYEPRDVFLSDLARQIYEYLKTKRPQISTESETGAHSTTKEDFIEFDPDIYAQVLEYAARQDPFAAKFRGRHVFNYVEGQGNIKFAEEQEIYHRSDEPRRNGENYYAPLPVDDILKELVFNHGIRPSSATIAALLEAEHPFGNNPERLDNILECALYLARSETSEHKESDECVLEGKHENNMKTMADGSNGFRMDFGSLEQLFIICGRRGSADMMMKAWDLAEALKFPLSETLYEATIQTFLRSYRSDHHAFGVMKEMELQHGIKPSRALIRNVSRFLRSNISRIFHAYRCLQTEEYRYTTTGSLNCILTAYAELGDVPTTFRIFEHMNDFNVEPDIVSFTCLFEALALHIKSTVSHRLSPENKDENLEDSQNLLTSGIKTTKDEVASVLETVDVIFDMMKSRNLEMDHECWHQYIRILCFLEEVDRALEILRKLTDRKERILMTTYSSLSYSSASIGRFDVARATADMILEAGYHRIPESLLFKIDEFEQKCKFDELDKR